MGGFTRYSLEVPGPRRRAGTSPAGRSFLRHLPRARSIPLAEAAPVGRGIRGSPGSRPQKSRRSTGSRRSDGTLGESGGRRRDDGSGRKKLFAHRIDSEIQPFQGVGAEQGHVARLGEYDQVGRVRAASVDDGKADVAFDRPAVGHDEALLALRGDSERVEDGPWYP